MSFPQKVIASGMSLVLAFGLSPLGQVPAYADEGLQSHAALQTQDGPNYVLSDKDFTFVVNDVANSATYNGNDQKVTFILFDSAGTRIEPTADGTSNAAGQFRVTLTSPDEDADPQVETLSNTNKQGTNFTIRDAGTYQVKVESTSNNSNYYGKGSQTYTFEVGKLDLTTVNFVAQDVNGTTITRANDQAAHTLPYTGSDQTVKFAAVSVGKDKAPVTISQGIDFSADIASVNGVDEYTATVTAKGSNCKDGTDAATGGVKYATVSFDVSPNAFLYTADADNEADYATATSGSGAPVAIKTGGTATPLAVSAETASDPFVLKYGDYVLAEGVDYNVKFTDDPSPSASSPTVYTKAQLATVTGGTYYAHVTITNNYSWSESPAASFTITCTNGKAVFDKVVKSAVLADGTYLGGKDVTADPKDGGVFTAPDGTDVSELVGTAFTVGTDYKVLATNTAATAKLRIVEYIYTVGGTALTASETNSLPLVQALAESKWTNDSFVLDTTADTALITALGTDGVTAGVAGATVTRTIKEAYPVAAGEYTVSVDADNSAQDGLVQTGVAPITEVKYTVNKRPSKVGKEVGDLEVTLNDQAYEGGNYLAMKNVTNADKSGVVSVEMYTAKNGAKQIVDPTYTSATGATITNWKVSYTKEDGTPVSAPAEVGTYKALFEFPSTGNLAGTESFEKTFKVETGDISDLVSGLYMQNSAKNKVAPFHTYTGDGIDIDPKDLFFLDKGGKNYLTTKDAVLDGTEVKVSYTSRQASVDPETGLPTGVGTYNIIATFSGNYSGTVEGVLSVNKLPLTNMTNGNNSLAELQYAVDGGWDTDYSVAKTGSAITPEVRIVLKDGNEKKGEKATVVSPDVYSAVFTKNTDAGQAAVTLSAKGAGVGNLSVSTGAQEGAFTITDKAFSDIAAYLELSKDSVAFGEFPAAGIEVKMNSSAGLLPYGAGQAAEYVDGTGTITVTGVTAVYDYNATSSTGKWYTVDENGDKTSTEITATTDEDVSAQTSTGQQKYTNVTFTSAADQPVSQKGSSWYAWSAGEYKPLTSTGNAEGTATVSSFKAYEPIVATVTVTGATVYVNSATAGKYFANSNGTSDEITAGAVTLGDEGTESGGITDYMDSTVVYSGAKIYSYNGTDYVKGSGVSYTPLSATSFNTLTGTSPQVAVSNVAPSAGDYSLKVLKDGAEVEGVTFESAAPYTTVTMKGLSKAGTYTVVAGAGSYGQYGGRVTKDFTIEAIDLFESGKYAVTYTPSAKTLKGTKANVVLSSSDAWDVDYDSALANTKDGITLAAKGTLAITPASSTVDPSTGTGAGSLTKDTDYTLTYDANKEAGTAKVTIKGKNDYAGEKTFEFAINKGKISEAKFYTSGLASGKPRTSGYRVDFDSADFVKNAAGDDVIVFTGSKVTPGYEVNYYITEADAFAAGLYKKNADGDALDADGNVIGSPTAANVVFTVDVTKPYTFLAKSEYEPQWFANENVYYPDGSASAGKGAQLLVKASGNYEGTIVGRFQIDPIDLSTAQNVSIEIPDVAYAATPADPVAKITYNGVELKAGADYLIQGDGKAEVGEHTATIVDVPGGNYTISEGAIYRTYNVKPAEEITYDLNGATVALSKSKFTYTGAVQQPTVGDVTLANGTVIDKSLVSVSVPDSTDAKAYQVTVTGKASNVSGTATASYTIDKAANTLKIAKKTRTAKGVSKAKKTVAGPKVSKKGQGTVTFKKVSVSKSAKKFKVNAKTGKITVKKGTKAGKYKVTVSAKASGNSNYKASATLKAVVTVKVKK